MALLRMGGFCDATYTRNGETHEEKYEAGDLKGFEAALVVHRVAKKVEFEIVNEEKLKDQFEAVDVEVVETALQESFDWSEKNQHAEKEEFQEKQRETEGVLCPMLNDLNSFGVSRGDQVSFNVKQSDKGPRATNVKVLTVGPDGMQSFFGELKSFNGGGKGGQGGFGGKGGFGMSQWDGGFGGKGFGGKGFDGGKGFGGGYDGGKGFGGGFDSGKGFGGGFDGGKGFGGGFGGKGGSGGKGGFGGGYDGGFGGGCGKEGYKADGGGLSEGGLLGGIGGGATRHGGADSSEVEEAISVAWEDERSRGEVVTNKGRVETRNGLEICVTMRNTVNEEKLKERFEAVDKERIERAWRENLDWCENSFSE
jgi:hypothetical protein